jgi:F-type H+-transporting ATPase subunit b
MNLARLAGAGSGLLGAGLPVLASAEAAGGFSLVEPRIGTMFWTLVTFAILVVLLRRLAWRPLLGAIEARERSIQESLEQAKRQREEAAAQLDEHRKLLVEARRERAAAVEKGRQDAEAVKAEIVQEAGRQREHLLEQAQTQIQAGLQQARVELRRTAAELAIRAAEKLLVRNLDDATQRRLVEEHVAELERSAELPRPIPGIRA